jgi:hypothetical protein
MTALTVLNDANNVANRLIKQARLIPVELDLKARKTALLVQRDARRNVPKAHSELVNAITFEKLRNGEYQIEVAKDYGRSVEEGSGPGGLAPIQSIIDWLQVRRITPNNPEMEIDELAFLIQRKIASRGSPAQPYMAPAVAARNTTLLTLVSQGLKYVR